MWGIFSKKKEKLNKRREAEKYEEYLFLAEFKKRLVKENKDLFENPELKMDENARSFYDDIKAALGKDRIVRYAERKTYDTNTPAAYLDAFFVKGKTLYDNSVYYELYFSQDGNRLIVRDRGWFLSSLYQTLYPLPEPRRKWYESLLKRPYDLLLDDDVFKPLSFSVLDTGFAKEIWIASKEKEIAKLVNAMDLTAQSLQYLIKIIEAEPLD